MKYLRQSYILYYICIVLLKSIFANILKSKQISKIRQIKF
nr:MAG TPA: hypothetical protein [Caudoviricetes sp.]